MLSVRISKNLGIIGYGNYLENLITPNRLLDLNSRYVIQLYQIRPKQLTTIQALKNWIN